MSRICIRLAGHLHDADDAWLLAVVVIFFLLIPQPPRATPYPTLFPYTTLFRSRGHRGRGPGHARGEQAPRHAERLGRQRSEEHTSELQPHSEISYAVFCLKKKKNDVLKAMSNPTLVGPVGSGQVSKLAT